jgi:hypothetical protein
VTGNAQDQNAKCVDSAQHEGSIPHEGFSASADFRNQFSARSTADHIIAGIDLSAKRFVVTDCNSDNLPSPQDWTWRRARLGQRIPLDTFAIGALTGKLKFAPLIGQTIPMRVVAAGSACWKCKQPTMSIQWLTVLADAMYPGFDTLNISLEVLDAGPGRGMEIDSLAAQLPALEPVRIDC